MYRIHFYNQNVKLPLSHLLPGNITEEEMKQDEQEVKRVQEKIRGIQRILQEHSAIFWQKIVLQCCELTVNKFDSDYLSTSENA